MPKALKCPICYKPLTQDLRCSSIDCPVVRIEINEDGKISNIIQCLPNKDSLKLY